MNKRRLIMSAALGLLLLAGTASSKVDWEWDWGKYKTDRFSKPVYSKIKRTIGDWVANNVEDEFHFEFGCHRFKSESDIDLGKIYCTVSYQAPEKGGLTFFTFDKNGGSAVSIRSIDDFN